MGWRFHIIIKSVGRAEEYRRQPYGTDERELVDTERPVGTDHVGHGLVVGERTQGIEVLAIVLGDRLHTPGRTVLARELPAHRATMFRSGPAISYSSAAIVGGDGGPWFR